MHYFTIDGVICFVMRGSESAAVYSKRYHALSVMVSAGTSYRQAAADAVRAQHAGRFKALGEMTA